jgi:hypothetical protein
MAEKWEQKASQDGQSHMHKRVEEGVANKEGALKRRGQNNRIVEGPAQDTGDME